MYAWTIVNGTKPTEDKRLDQKGTDRDDPIAMREVFRVGFMLTYAKSGG